ncbi:MAG TPA: pitrilysin family protein [Candidatus Kapabacteria bacterium]|nr:pitrilysin family protein [Candidatus Kapabacteria bacterium]
MSSGHISFEEFRLENGLRVILHEDHTSAVVCLDIAYHVGSKNEDLSRRGFAHLFEHLLFDGSAHVPRGKFDEYITQAGGHDNAYTTEDKTNYYEVLPAHQLELALWLESDRMLEFAATEIGLATQKQVVKEEKRERYDNTPYGSLSIRMNRLAYTQYPYWWAVIGDMETIDAATLTDVRTFFERFYVPENAVLVLAGDFDREQAGEGIRRYFGSIPNVVPPIVQPPFDDPDLSEERRVIVDSEPVPLPAVFYAYRVPPEGSREHLALDLLTDILSSGESSRLYRKLVYELQIASETASYVDGREMPGLLYLYAIHREPHGAIGELEAALQEAVSEVVLHEVSETELQKAKNKVEARTVASRVTVQGRADQLAHAALFYEDANRVNSLLDEYGSITLEEVRHAAGRYLKTSNRCSVLYLTGESIPE